MAEPFPLAGLLPGDRQLIHATEASEPVHGSPVRRADRSRWQVGSSPEATRQCEAQTNCGSAASRGYDARWRQISEPWSSPNVPPVRALGAHVLVRRPTRSSPGAMTPRSSRQPPRLLQEPSQSGDHREKWKRKAGEMKPAQTSYGPRPTKIPISIELDPPCSCLHSRPILMMKRL
jgi:hypothetical protein